MPTSPTSIAALPTVPQRSDPANFAARGDSFLTALPTFRTEINALGANVYANAVEAEASATTATSGAGSASASAAAAANSAIAAASSAGAAVWVTGTTYSAGAVVWSPITRLTYRRISTGAGTTDPSADPSNWGLASVAAAQLVVVTASSVNAAAGGQYVLTNAGASTVTLPASPAVGDWVEVLVANGRTDNVVARNGRPMMTLGEDMIIDNQYAALRLRYVDATLGWRIN